MDPEYKWWAMQDLNLRLLPCVKGFMVQLTNKVSPAGLKFLPALRTSVKTWNIPDKSRQAGP